MDNEELVSQAEAARRLGVSAPAVCKLVKSGKLPLVNGKVAIGMAREVLAARLNPARSKILRNRAEEIEQGDGVLDFAAAKARREHYEGLRAKLEYERRTGELVEIAKVKRAAYKLGRMTRDAVLAVPTRIATDLAAESDHWQIQQLVTDALRHALDDVSKLAASDLDRDLI